MIILAKIRVAALVLLLAGYASAASAGGGDDGQSLVAARQAAKALLEPVGEAYGCEFTRLILKPRSDGYVAYAGCAGERCAEALDVLNVRGESRSLYFVFEKPYRDEEAPDREPVLGQFDLIHEINPDM